MASLAEWTLRGFASFAPLTLSVPVELARQGRAPAPLKPGVRLGPPLEWIT